MLTAEKLFSFVATLIWTENFQKHLAFLLSPPIPYATWKTYFDREKGRF